jgi:glutathione S-transferase
MSEAKVEVYVKANAKDGKGLGDCPLCQRVMMVLRTKGIAGEYIPVNMTLIPEAFRSFCVSNGVPVKVPILRHGEYVVYNPNDIVYYIDKEWPEPIMKSENAMANKVGANLYSKFCGYMRNKDKSFDEKLRNGVLDELKKLNNFLGSVNSPGKYLDGDELKHPDCDTLPKLNQVKVALKKFKDFDIPDYLPDLLAYMEAAKEDPAFTSSCPPDDAIIEAWRKHLY